MNEQANIQLVKQAYELYGRRDMQSLLAMMTEDVDWNLPGPSEIPWAGRRKGRQGAEEFFRLLSAADELESFEPREFFASDEKVVVLGYYRGRARSTGKIVEDNWVQVFTVRSGKIAGFSEYYDTASVAASYRRESAGGREAFL